MTLNVTLPMVERLRTGDLYELMKSSPDDTDEQGKKEAEKSNDKGKEAFPYSSHLQVTLKGFYLDLFKNPVFDKYDFPVSEHYLATPERPPQA